MSSTSHSGGNQVDGLPPASSKLLASHQNSYSSRIKIDLIFGRASDRTFDEVF